MTVRWVTELLGTGPANEAFKIPDAKVVDVRDLVDKDGNRPDVVRSKIAEGVEHLKRGQKIIVCCDYGISRSNAIAAGMLVLHEKLPFGAAVRMVQEATGETEIKIEPLDVVRIAIEGEIARVGRSSKRAVLVTGAGGFVGGAVYTRLVEEFDVFAPTRAQLNLETGQANLSLFTRDNQIDSIIHLANPRVYTSNLALGSTLTMLRNVLGVCVSQDIQLIYPSGWEIYSGYSGYLLANESVPALTRGPYGEAKYLAEVLIEHWKRTTALRCSVLRASPVYGAGSEKPKFIYNFADKARNSIPIVTHRYLNGDPALDLLHIGDFTDAIYRALQRKHMGVLNLGTGVTISTPTIAEMIRTELHSTSCVENIQIDAYTACIAMDHRKAYDILGWKPTVSFAEGFRDLLGEFRRAV